MGYKSSLELKCDISELQGLEDKLREVVKDSTKRSYVAHSVTPRWILYRYGAPYGLAVLMNHTPIGDDSTNWGYWDYGTHELFGGEHSKGTLRRGWITKNPSDAENDLSINNDILPNSNTAWRYVWKNVDKPRKIYGNHYYIELENCVPYGPYVEYGHHVVLPHTRTAYDEFGFPIPLEHHRISKDINRVNKGTGKDRWVPGKFFVQEATTGDNWQPVIDAMHAAYVTQLKKALSK